MALSRCKLVGLAVVAIFAGCDAVSQAQQNPTSLDNLKRAQNCDGSIPRFGNGNPTPPAGTINMNNDRGWCWAQFSFVSGNRYIVPPLQTTQPPQHGTLMTGGVNDRVRFAYRPFPGFVGNDMFVVHVLGPQHIVGITVSVIVTH